MEHSIKEKYLSSAAILMFSSIVVKIIGAVYKIPLTSYIGSVGRGYFSVAYNLIMPFHAVIMGAFPIALSKLVSKSLAKGDREHTYLLKKAAERLFFIVGSLGMVIMLLISRIYCDNVSSSPKSILTVIILAPTVLFSAMAASKRAFSEGHMNMIPTAVSQTVEAVFKMVFGLLFARLSMSYMWSEYEKSGMIFAVKLQSDSEALSFIYPITSAAAMAGVTVGSFVSLLYVSAYIRGKYPIPILHKKSTKIALKELINFSLPLVIATVIQSVFQFLDSSSVQYCLSLCDVNVLKDFYRESLGLIKINDSEMVTYLVGLYSSVLDFRSLIPGVIMSLGVASVPAISAAFESASTKFNDLLTNIFKYTVVLSTGGGAALALFSSDILSLFYSSSNPDIVAGGSNLLFCFGVVMLSGAFASTAVFAVQALGYSKKLIAAFVVGGIVRVAINYFLIKNASINLFGGVVSSAVAFLIISVWCVFIIVKKTNCTLSFTRIFIKPIAVTVISYFSVQIIREALFCSLTHNLSFILAISIYLMVFVTLLFLFSVLSLKDLKFISIK